MPKGDGSLNWNSPEALPAGSGGDAPDALPLPSNLCTSGRSVPLGCSMMLCRRRIPVHKDRDRVRLGGSRHRRTPSPWLSPVPLVNRSVGTSSGSWGPGLRGVLGKRGL